MNALIVFALGVSDIDRAKQFYLGVLGCSVDQDHPQFVSFEAGDSPTAMALCSGDALGYDGGIPERANGFRGPTAGIVMEPPAIPGAVSAVAQRGKDSAAAGSRSAPAGLRAEVLAGVVDALGESADGCGSEDCVAAAVGV